MCTLYETIQSLCKERGVSGSRMCLDLGLSKSTLSDMKSGKKSGISVPTAQKIAGYFGITVDELYGAKKESPSEMEELSDKNSNILDEVDIAFYGDYKGLSEDDKATLRDMARIMRERRSKKQE